MILKRLLALGIIGPEIGRFTRNAGRQNPLPGDDRAETVFARNPKGGPRRGVRGARIKRLLDPALAHRQPVPIPVKVTRAQILENGIRCRCPNCGRRTIFQAGRIFKVNESCPNCGLGIEKGDGAFLGPFVINYGVTAFGVIIPIIILYAAGKLSAYATLAMTLAAALVVPLLLYRLSWGWWLMIYYFFLPDNVPANLEGRTVDDQ